MNNLENIKKIINNTYPLIYIEENGIDEECDMPIINLYNVPSNLVEYEKFIDFLIEIRDKNELNFISIDYNEEITKLHFPEKLEFIRPSFISTALEESELSDSIMIKNSAINNWFSFSAENIKAA